MFSKKKEKEPNIFLYYFNPEAKIFSADWQHLMTKEQLKNYKFFATELEQRDAIVNYKFSEITHNSSIDFLTVKEINLVKELLISKISIIIDEFKTQTGLNLTNLSYCNAPYNYHTKYKVDAVIKI